MSTAEIVSSDSTVDAPVDPPAAGPAADAVRVRRPLSRAVLRGQGLLGLVLVLLVVALGVLAPVLAPYSPSHQFVGHNLTGPSSSHWLGTDEVDRDVLSRTLYGIRVDLLVVFVAVPLGALVGVFVGLLSSWWDATDVLAQRVFDVVLAFPTLILGIGLSAFLGPGVRTVAVIIVAVELPVFGRLVRTSVRTIRELPYVEAAQVAGARPWWVLRRHVLPNSLEPLTVQLVTSMAAAVFIEGAMSFLGLGVRPPQPSLGSLIHDGTTTMYEDPTLAVGPLAVVVVLVLGLLLVSQSLTAARRA